MQYTNGSLHYSPSDVTRCVACPRIPYLHRIALEGGQSVPYDDDPSAALLARKGEEHEQAYLDALQSRDLAVVEIPWADGPRSFEQAADATLEAMRAGADVLYQATFAHDGWQGRADFLRRIGRPSDLGAWSYEVEDTKLARRTKPHVLLQLAFYSEHVGRLQGVEPESMYAVLGTGERQAFRYRDFGAYYRRVKARFEQQMAAGEAPYPYPVEQCNLCGFADECKGRWEADDHLSLVANIRRGQVVRLNRQDVRTVTQLAEAPADLPVRIGASTFDTLRDQAALQSHQRQTGEHTYRLLTPQSDRGLALLPPPSPGDLYFDIEGDPFYEAGQGLEYLLGVMWVDDGQPRYRAFWAHDYQGERRSFEEFIDFVHARLEVHPDLHIYHYAHYELTAIQRLMGKHGTREDEVDDLLRRDVLVDLYKVVRGAIRISHPSYSLKTVRTFFMEDLHDGDVQAGDDSILAYEQWIDTQDQALLDSLAEYNEHDCLSTLNLHRWLAERRQEAGVQHGHEIPWRLAPDAREATDEADEDLEPVKAALLEGVPEDPLNATSGQRSSWLLAQLLDYHRREAKPAWWAYFARLEATPEELLDDQDAIAQLTPAPGIAPEPDKRSLVHTFEFPAQEYKLKSGLVFDPRSEKSLTLVDVDDVSGTLRLKRGPGQRDEPLPTAIVAQGPYNTSQQRAAIRRFAQDVVANGLDTRGRYGALRDVLCRRLPRVSGRDEGAPLQTLEPEEAKGLVANLDDSHVFIQGPPGSGKTWLGARLIVHLIRLGKRIGVSANSHKAIHNLLAEVERVAADEDVTFAGLKKCSGKDPDTMFDGELIENSPDNADFTDRSKRLVAGTAWLFSREEMDSTLDYLFIDEAGQVSLADALAVGTSARNLVLLGDPLQLAQVSQGVHPGRVGDSVLEHLLGDAQTVPEDRGLFLARTRRMHPAVCGFISEMVYESRLESWEGCANRSVSVGGQEEVGIRFIPVEHEGNTRGSTEEVDVVRREIDRILDGGTYTDESGVSRTVTAHDILVVTPYNVQVRWLRERLPAGIEVGTVDKFQGREAPVVIFSMASSSGEDLPRSLEFLFSRNRLIVAVSRAQCLAVVVASPRLLETSCRTVEQMAMVNALCRLAEIAR